MEDRTIDGDNSSFTLSSSTPSPFRTNCWEGMFVNLCFFGRKCRSENGERRGMMDLLPLVGGEEDSETNLETETNDEEGEEGTGGGAVYYRRNSPISLLPNDLLLWILGFLSAFQLCSLSTVCKHWQLPSKNNLLWQSLCLRRWGERPFTKQLDLPMTSLEEGTWKTIYREQLQKGIRIEEMRKSLSLQTRMRQNECDVQYKVVLLGAAGVGKTNILSRLTRDDFDSSSAPTVGIEFATRLMEVEQKIVKCQLWDIGTSETTSRSTRLLSSTYCRGAVGAFIVFDISQRSTFEKAEEYIRLWKDCSSRPFEPSCILLGQKSDLHSEEEGEKEGEVDREGRGKEEEEREGEGKREEGNGRRGRREVRSWEGEQLAKRFELDQYLEVSALHNVNIEDALLDLLTACHQKSNTHARRKE